MAQQNSTRTSWAFRPLPNNQVGDKKSWRFRSITTPEHSFSLIQFIAEMVVLQRYGLNVPPYFWYKKTNKPNIRKDFYNVQNHIAAMIKRKKQITALRLLSIVCEKFPPLPPKKIVTIKEKPVECSEQPLIELTAENIGNNMRATLKRVDINGQEEKITS